jgi:hypothetical protein
MTMDAPVDGHTIVGGFLRSLGMTEQEWRSVTRVEISPQWITVTSLVRDEADRIIVADGGPVERTEQATIRWEPEPTGTVDEVDLTPYVRDVRFE